MPVIINLRHLENQNLQLSGELPVGELDLELHDPVIHAERPLKYRMEVQQMEKSLLAQGRLTLSLQCQCVRCLKSFEQILELAHWARLVPLEGEDAAPIASDCVDLTPYIREDILLEFPQHPVCDVKCGGLSKAYAARTKKTGRVSEVDEETSTWHELNKLKF